MRGPNDGEPSVMQISAVPHSEMLAIQGQSDRPQKYAKHESESRCDHT